MFDFYRVDQVLGTPETVWSFLGKTLPVATLVFGILLNRSITKADKRRKDRKTTRDLLTEIELLNDPMENQGRAVDEFIQVLKQPRLEQADFTTIYSLKLDRVSILDRAGVVDHLEQVFRDRPKAIEKANELFLGCDVLTVQHEQLHEVVGHFISEAQQVFEQWRGAANALLMAINDQMVDVERQERKPTDDSLIGPVLALTHGSEKMNEDIFEQFEHVHEPLMHVLAKNRKDARVDELSKLNSAVVKAAMALQREREYAISKLDKTKNAMMNRYVKLKVAADGLRPAT